MEIGKLLKEKHGFDKPETLISFKCKYNYSDKFIESLLNDRFPELLACHIDDISEFTGISVKELLKLQTPKPAHGMGHPHAPLGRPWIFKPVFAKIAIKDIEECQIKK